MSGTWTEQELAAYHARYDRYGPQIVGTVTGAHAASVTLRFDPDKTI